MIITIASADDRVRTLEVDGSETIETLKAILEVEFGMPAAQQVLMFGQNQLSDSATLTGSGVGDGDLLMLLERPSQQQHSQQQQHRGGGADVMSRNADGSFVDPRAVMSAIAGNPTEMASITARIPPLAEAIRKGDVEQFQQIMCSMHAQQQQLRQLQEEEEALLSADPFDIDAQRKIAEMIQKKNIEENYMQAYENTPEVFASVYMLYVNMEVNKYVTKAFIDSGAQSTIMTQTFAEQCNLMHLVDKRFQGIAMGVGQSKIIGRIHSAPVMVGGKFVASSIIVLEQKTGPQFIFGLDNLKRHQCCIDLHANVLRFTSIDVSLPFLSESEIPKDFDRLASGEYAEKPDAGGDSIDQPSSSQPAAAAPTAQPARAPAAAGADDAKVEQLMSLTGRTRQECVQVLQLTGGDLDAAASYLMGF